MYSGQASNNPSCDRNNSASATAFAGIPVADLVEGAKRAVEEGFSGGSPEFGNAVVEGAWYLYEGALTGRNVVDHFFFSDSFESVGKWYRQLLAESVGKEYAKGTRRRVSAGLTPTVSIGSADLHSVGQLYLGGPRDKSFVFVRTKPADSLRIPESGLSSTVENLPGKSLSFLMEAIAAGTKDAYLSKGIPYVEWVLSEGSAFDLGYFMQTKMGEVAALGFLFGVDPFDQPNVEDYKSGTRRALAS